LKRREEFTTEVAEESRVSEEFAVADNVAEGFRCIQQREHRGRTQRAQRREEITRRQVIRAHPFRTNREKDGAPFAAQGKPSSSIGE